MEEAGHVAPTLALLFVLTCILIGIATQYFLSFVPVPYTALLFVFGLGIGLFQAVPHGADAFTETLKLWMGMDPHLLLLIFLPTIGFSKAIGQEPHLLRKNWGQILTLAWPGVVVGFLLNGLCAKYFFPYGWTWAQALLFGVMFTATDPVPVTAVLRKVGASPKLLNVIDGESLINEESALVIFLALQQFVEGQPLDAGQVVLKVLHLALVGSAIGLGLGFATSFWLAWIFNDPCLEVVLTFGAAYACYFVAEDLAGAAGLLAVVVMGFSMSVLGGRQIMNRIKTEMHTFWEALEWLAHTILFIWAGVTLGLLLPLQPGHRSVKLTTRVDFSQYITAVDVGYAALLYLWLLVSRAVTIGVFHPLLRSGRVGYALDWKSAIVLVWSGLRGMVGVAMSLFILFNRRIENSEYKAHCAFHMALMAFATVVINGSTAKYLLKALGMLRMTPQQVQVLEHVLQEVDDIRHNRLENHEDLHPNTVLGSPDEAAVRAWTHIDARGSVSSAAQNSHGIERPSQQQGGPAPSPAGDRANGGADGPRAEHWRELVSQYRVRLLQVVKAKYGELYQGMELGTGEIGTLQEVTDAAVDAAAEPHKHKHQHKQQQHKQQQQQQHAPADPDIEKAVASGAAGGLTDWQQLLGRLEASSWHNAVGRLFGTQLGVPLLQQQAASKLMLVNAFVVAHSAAQQLIYHHLEQLNPAAAAAAAGADGASQSPAGSAASGSAAAVAAADNSEEQQQQQQGEQQDEGEDSDELEAARLVLRESHDEVSAAQQYAHEVLLPAHPQLAQQLVSRFVAIKVLEEQLDFIESTESAGLVAGEEVKEVQAKARQRLELLQHAHTWRLPHKPAPSGKPTGRLQRSGSSTGTGGDAPSAGAGAGAGAGAAPAGEVKNKSGTGGGGGRERSEANGLLSVNDFKYTSNLRIRAASGSRKLSRQH